MQNYDAVRGIPQHITAFFHEESMKSLQCKLQNNESELVKLEIETS